MINAIIIDDEEDCIVTLKSFIESYCEHVRVIGVADTVKSGFDLFMKAKPDLLFLDIKMNDGTGFDLLEKILGAKKEMKGYEVIFTTAHNDYAIKAFKFSAIDYLLKPINIDELITSVSKAGEKISNKKKDIHFQVLIDNVKAGTNQEKKIMIPTSNGFQLIALNEVLRCEADENYTNFHLTNGECILVSKTLKEYDILLSDCNFFRIHKKNLINLNYVSKYIKGTGGVVILEDQSELEVSRYRKDDFIKKMNEAIL